jgi:hypothetical protein
MNIFDTKISTVIHKLLGNYAEPYEVKRVR